MRIKPLSLLEEGLEKLQRRLMMVGFNAAKTFCSWPQHRSSMLLLTTSWFYIDAAVTQLHLHLQPHRGNGHLQSEDVITLSRQLYTVKKEE